jgi:very-short-patch-repair endonuclease
LGGYRFNRQVTIGPYIVDFLCREKMLVVEIDGATHGEEHEVAYDCQRTSFLQALGYRVYRANNEDIYGNLIGVLDGVLMALDRLPSRFTKRPPPPAGPPPAS